MTEKQHGPASSQSDGGRRTPTQSPKHNRVPRSALPRPVHPKQNRVVDAATSFAGSLTFVYLHVAWFGGWVLVNGGILGAGLVFDAFPFGLLTLVVSLEAIFLSTFVLISQNRQAEQTKVQSQLNYEADVRSEIWTVRIGERLGLDAQGVEQQVQQALTSNDRTIAADTARPEPVSRSGES